MQQTEMESELVIIGHGAPVTTLSFSADGKTLATASSDQTAIVWDVETGGMRRLFRPGAWGDVSLLSPDGTTLVACSGHVWDVPTGRLLRRSHRYGAPLACSPDGRMLACSSLKSGDDGFSILVTTLRTGRTLHRFPWHDEEPNTLAFSADGNVLGVSSYLGASREERSGDDEERYLIATIDLQTGERRTFHHDAPVSLFGADLGRGVRLVAVSEDGSLLWNAERGERLPPIFTYASPPSPIDMQSVRLSPDGRLLAIGTERGEVHVWSVATAELLWRQQAHNGWVREIAITQDGRTLATAGNDHTVRLWDAWTGAAGLTLGGRGAAVEAVAFDPNGETITSIDREGVARLWRIAPPSLERRETLPGLLARQAPLKPDTARNLWRVPTSALPAESHLLPYTEIVALSPDGSLIALQHQSGEISLWERHRRLLSPPLPTTEAPWSVKPVFSPDNRLLAVPCQDPQAIQIFDVAAGNVRRTLLFGPEDSDPVELAFSPDSRLLAAGQIGFGLLLWNVQNGKRKRRWRLDRDSVSALAFTPQADLLAVGTDYDETVQLKSLTRHGKNRRLIGHTDGIRSADFSQDGTLLVTAAQDATIRLWETATGRLLTTFLTLPEDAWLAYTPQGDYTGSPSIERFLLYKIGEDLVPVALADAPMKP